MATDVGHGKSAPATKYENFVRAQLARAQGRIRTLDLTAALLVFAAGTLAYAVVVALLDRLLELPPVVRQGAWGVYLLASLAYLTAYVVLPLSRRINPYFAARQLERSVPGSKNSVVNWLDLREENLPSAIRGAVGQRAARDLGQADLDKAVSARRAYWAGGVAALCCLGFLIALFTLGPALFLAHLGRTFAPFGANGASAGPTSTQLTIVKPVDGDAVAPDGRPVEISVQVGGRVPDPKAADAPKLLYRYEPSAPYQSRLLDQDDSGRWGTTLAPNEVQDGFWYKVTGGDAETKEYRVQRTPRISDFKADYQFRPYLARVKETRLERKIEAVRGTQVDVTVHANRELKEGYLQFQGANGAKTVTRGEVLPDDATGFRVRLTLDESSQYRICFTSTQGEEFVEQQPAPLIAVPDAAPVVTLTKPAELKEKPGWVPPLQADALLGLEGDATDDIGVAAIHLNLRVDNGPALPPQEYRSGEKLKLPHGGNPVSVHYEDFVDLAKLKNPADPLFVVRPGMVLEYWLTAEDACDYPKPNVGESKHYRVQIVEPMNNDKVKKEQQENADKSKQENENKQDKQNQQEDAERQKKNLETESKNDQKSKGQQQEGSNGGKDGKPDDKKPGDKDGQQQNPENKGNTASNNAKPPDNPNQQPNGGDKTNAGTGQSNKEDVPKELNQAIKEQQKDQEGTGKSDPKQQPAGDGKDAGDKPKNDTADAKPGPQNQPDGQHNDSAAKDQGQPDAKQPQQGEGKPGGDPKMQPDAKPGENKQGGDPRAQPDARPGQGKENKPDASAQPGADKSGGKPEEQKSAGGDKPQGDAAPAKADKAESKGSNSPDASADARPAGDAKDKAAPETKAEAKGGGPENHDKDAEKSEAKADGTKSPMGDQKPAAEAKPQGAKADKQDVAQRKSDGGGEGEPNSEEMKPQDVAELAKDLKSADPAKREEAAKKLQEIEKEAKDEQARKDAGKALDDAGVKSEDTQVAESKPMAGSDGPPTDGKDKEKPSESKSGVGDNPSEGGKETPKDDPKTDVTKGDSKGDGQPTDKHGPMGDNKETKPGEAKGGPGNGAKTRHGDFTQANDTTAPPATPEKPVEQKASVLQLRKFLDTVDKKVLEDAKRDPAAMKKLQEEARKWLAEHPPEGEGQAPVGPQQGGALGSKAGSRSSPDGKTANDDPDNGGRPLPPPGYRDPYKEFTKLLSPGGDK